MPRRADLEYQIAEKLRNISAVDMQRLAEEFARVEWPARYKALRIFGRTAQGQTRLGWPDAGVELPDGRIDGVEATRAQYQEWRQHLKQDLEKAADAKYPKLAGFLFVAGHPDASCSARERADWRAQFGALGIPVENVEILVGMDIISRICDPEFARLRLNYLNIPSHPTHFRLVTWTEQSLWPGQLEPTSEEYLGGIVHRAALIDQILPRLTEDGSAVVLGRGAAGKTVLALMISLEPAFRSVPCYYLSTKDCPGAGAKALNEIATDLLEFGNHGTLFILDDIHLADKLASATWNAWQGIAENSRPKLLLIGRETREHNTPTSKELSSAFVLTAADDEVRGVFRRLAARTTHQTRPQIAIPIPPNEVVRLWVNTFGGNPNKYDTTVDLMALSAAIQNRIDQLLDGNWTLTEEDARTEVRDNYLRNLGDNERRNLIQLSQMPEDFRLAHDALSHSWEGLRESKRRGLVYEIALSRSPRRYYYFAHAALGHLIRTASEHLAPVEEEYRALAVRCPVAGFQLAEALLKAGNPGLAKDVLQSLIDDPHWLHQFDGDLGDLQDGIQLLLDIRTADELTAELLTDSTILHAIVRRSSFDFFLDFIDYADGRRLNFVSQAIIERAATSLDDLVATAPQMPTQVLLNCLDRTERSDLTLVRQALINNLQEHTAAVTESLLRLPLHEIVYFLSYTERGSLRALRQAVIHILVQQLDRFVDTALQTQFHFFSTLRYLERPELAILHQAVIEAFETHSEVLADHAFETPPNELSVFLAHTERPNYGVLRRSIIERFEKRPDLLARNICRSSLTGFRGLMGSLDHADFAQVLPPLIVELTKQSEELGDALVRTNLADLSAFFSYLERPDLKTLRRAIIEQLESREDYVLAAALRTPPDFVLSILRNFEHRVDLHGLRRLLVRGLEQHAGVMVTTSLQSSLNPIASFLSYATKDDLSRLRHSIIAALLAQPDKVAQAALVSELRLLTLLLRPSPDLLPLQTVIIKAFEAKIEGLTAIALDTPLAELSAFLKLTENEELEPLRRILIRGLLLHFELLAEKMLHSPAVQFASFLNAVLHAELSELRRVLVAHLEGQIDRIIELPLRAQLHTFSAFFNSLQHVDYRKIRVEVIRGIENQVDRLIDLGLENLLGDLVPFFRCTEHPDLVKVRLLFVRGVEQQMQRFAQKALESRFDHLSAFIQYAMAPDLVAIREKLMASLLAPAAISLLVSRAYREPPNSLMSLLDVPDLGQAIVLSIDRKQWDQARLNYVVENPMYFSSLHVQFTSRGRPELAEALASAHVLQARKEVWNPSVVDIEQVTQILRLARNVSRDQVAHFLTQVVTPDRLRTQYRNAEPLKLARSLFAIALHLDATHWSRFRTPSLVARMRMHLERCGPEDSERWVRALSLLGAFASIGGDVSEIEFHAWPNDPGLASIVGKREARSDQRRLTLDQMQLWLGLREMARIRVIPARVRPSVGDWILALARANVSSNENMARLNRGLIEWLDNCARQSWLLTRPLELNRERIVSGKDDRREID
jgi:hypothetical protein